MSTQPVTEMSTRNISLGVKAVGARATLPPSCADCLEIWDPQKPSGLDQGCDEIGLP